MRGPVRVLLWLLVMALAAAVASHAQYSADLSAFLPRSPTPAQQLLVDQLREGPASHIILVAIEGGDAAARARVSRALRHRLRLETEIASVSNGESSAANSDQQYLFAHRYVLSPAVRPERFTTQGLADAIEESIDLLSSSAGLLTKSLFARDPTGEMLETIAELGESAQPQSADGIWVSRNGGRALLLVHTRASGSDTDGQEHAIETVRRHFSAVLQQPGSNARGVHLKLSGTGVFSVSARHTIQHEALRLSIVSILLIIALLLAVYRSVPVLLLGLLPVACSALIGIAAVAIGFGIVHGITLAFGITLIGESVDYSIYYFIQSSQALYASPAADWRRSLWPTIRLGMFTSVVGFASLLPSGFPGLAQLGLFSIAGLMAAALITRFVLPELLPQRFSVRDLGAWGSLITGKLVRLRARELATVLVPIVAAITLYLHRDTLWNRELSALSPVPAADQLLDAQLRADLGAPNLRSILVVSGDEMESVLRDTERVAMRLDSLVASNVIAGFDSPARFLPSLATQQIRRRALPAPAELRERLSQALTGLPLRAQTLNPFIEDVATARATPLLRRADLEGTQLANGFDALMSYRDGKWRALLPLHATDSGDDAYNIDIGRVRAAIADVAPERVLLLDLKQESDALYASYLAEAVHLSLAGFVAIVLLLLAALRSVSRVARVVTPLLLAVLTVAALLVASGVQLTIFHLVGMLLIVAVGSNYALFFDRGTAGADRQSTPLTIASLLIANATTVTGFGVLAFSTVPVLNALGSTVAAGALLALVYAALLSRPQGRTAV